jgi:O-antigen/teichoic acid export membrane protein
MILGFGISFSQYSGIVLLYSINRHHLFAKMTILEGLLNLVLSLLLVKKFGVAGVALGTVIPMIFMKMLIQPYLVCSSLNISFREYYRPHFLTWLICLVAFAIIKLINFFPQDLPVTNLPSFILWAAGLGSLFFITNVVLINLFNTNKLKFGFYDQAH